VFFFIRGPKVVTFLVAGSSLSSPEKEKTGGKCYI
jgi:hypothetical protein